MDSPLHCILSYNVPTVSIYESSGQPHLHGNIPVGSTWASHSVANLQPLDNDEGSSPAFSVWVDSTMPQRSHYNSRS